MVKEGDDALNLFLSSTLCWQHSVDRVIEIANDLGFEGVEVWAEQVWFHRTPINQIIEAKEKYNVKLTFHAASWDLNLCALNEGIRQQSINEVEKSMLLAREIGALNVTVHPGKRTLTESWTQWHYDQLVTSFSSLAQFASNIGVEMSIEQMEHEKKEFIIDARSINELINDLPSTVKVIFDIAHVPLEKDILQYYSQIERINKIHVSDVTHSKYHVPLGSGGVQVETLLYMIMENQHPVILEGFDQNEGFSNLNKNVRFLRDKLNLSIKEVTSENISYK